MVEGVQNWRNLGCYLWVPDSKCGENVEVLITCWLTTDPFPSWRRLIRALYVIGEKGIADSVRHYAEPLAGTSFDKLGECKALWGERERGISPCVR